MHYDSEKKISYSLNPIDSIEEIIYRYDLDFLRDTPNALSITFKGLWRYYRINFDWDEFKNIINISCSLEINNSKKINKNISSLIPLINKKVSLGYFEFCTNLDDIFFNYKVSIKGIKILSTEQIENFIDVVVYECDKFFPVFYVFIEEKQDPNYALKTALIETCGEA